MNSTTIEIKNIVYASLVKRIFAIIIDLLFFGILFCATFLPATEGLFDYGFGTMDALKDTLVLQVKSGLFVDRSAAQDYSSVTNISSTLLVDENGYFTFDGYEKYIKATYYFYFQSPFSEEIEDYYFDHEPTIEEKNQWYNENVLLIGWDKDYDAYFYPDGSLTNSPVTLNENNEITGINVKIKETVIFDGTKYTRNGDSNQKNQQYIVAYLKIFTDADKINGTYHIACNNLARVKEYRQLYKRLEDISRYEAYISIAIASAVYFMIIPLFFKNGETLGMKIMSIGLVNSLGYQVAKKQTFAKFLFISLEVYVGFFTFFLFYLLDYLIIVFTKKHRSLSDLVSATIMIDTKTSVWFIDKKTEDILTKQVVENLDNAGIFNRENLEN